MTTCSPSEFELSEAITSAARAAVKDLFSQHPGRYYYVSLVTTGEAHPPILSAWSEEALEAAVKGARDEDAYRWGLKWSYADSPFCCYGDEYFSQVNELFSKRPDIYVLDDNARRAECDLRLRAMESAMAALDRSGLFGTGEARRNIVVSVEVMPPDYTNTQRAMRLNPPEALTAWLAEAAEDT